MLRLKRAATLKLRAGILMTDPHPVNKLFTAFMPFFGIWKNTKNILFFLIKRAPEGALYVDKIKRRF